MRDMVIRPACPIQEMSALWSALVRQLSGGHR
jgi:hypothetical protein